MSTPHIPRELQWRQGAPPPTARPEPLEDRVTAGAVRTLMDRVVTLNNRNRALMRANQALKRKTREALKDAHEWKHQATETANDAHLADMRAARLAEGRPDAVLPRHMEDGLTRLLGVLEDRERRRPSLWRRAWFRICAEDRTTFCVALFVAVCFIVSVLHRFAGWPR